METRIWVTEDPVRMKRKTLFASSSQLAFVKRTLRIKHYSQKEHENCIYLPFKRISTVSRYADN